MCSLFRKCPIKWTTKKYYTVGTIPKSYRKIIERDQMNTLITQIHEHLLFWLGTGISLKSGGAKPVLWVKTSTQS